MANRNLTHEALKERMSYDPETGEFTWKYSLWGRVAGEKVGWYDSRGYHKVSFNGANHYAHRLAWFYVHGVYPKLTIDHINGVKTDNRIANLREACMGVNSRNKPVLPSNTSGYPGVRCEGQKWSAKIRIKARSIRLGLFTNPEDAAMAYIEAKAKFFPDEPEAIAPLLENLKARAALSAAAHQEGGR